MKIRTRIGAGFLALVAFTLALGLLSLVQLANVAHTVEDIATGTLPRVQLIAQMREGLSDMRRSEARHLLSSARKEMKEIEASIAANRKLLVAMDGQIAPMLRLAEERQALEAYQKYRAAWFAANDTMAPASRAGKQDEATNIYNGESRAAFDAAMAEATKLSAMGAEQATSAWGAAKLIYRRAQLWLLGGIAGAVMLALVMAMRISRSIARPVEEAAHAAELIASGDMTIAVRAHGSDETAKLLRALDAMRQRLAHVVSAVRHSSDELANASVEMAQGNHDLSERTAMQASALEQTAASMEQLGATARRNTDNALHGNQLALDASQVAVKGRDAVREVVSTMQGIDESSRKIAEIIRIIDAIAFQTNILALNAAVESARAGEQGRGFAVVASEVRTLAARSADAAREIKALVQTSVERVRNGTALVGEAGSTMMEVVAAIQRVADIMGEISTASGEQLNGVSQVGAAVTHLDRATQQNATLVQEIAAAANGLRSQAAGLVHTVAVFKVDSDADAVAAAPARPA